MKIDLLSPANLLLDCLESFFKVKTLKNNHKFRKCRLVIKLKNWQFWQCDNTKAKFYSKIKIFGVNHWQWRVNILFWLRHWSTQKLSWLAILSNQSNFEQTVKHSTSCHCCQMWHSKFRCRSISDHNNLPEKKAIFSCKFHHLKPFLDRFE